MIETYHLSKLYNRGVYALRDLSLTIDKGEFVFLTGPSGAGKSTLLRLLLREDLPSEGELKVLGRDLKTLSKSQVQTFRRSVGFVFQDFRLIPRFSVLDQQIPLAGIAHACGTARFGNNPADSVLDVHCRAHDVDNLYVVDTSFFPSSSAVNPALTAMANALRVGDHILERLDARASVEPAAAPGGNGKRSEVLS